MCDESGGGSLLDDIILMAMIMYLLYIVFLAIPIIPYFDIILKIVFSIYMPDSFLGKVITGIVLFTIGFVMLEAAKAIGEKIFVNRSAMFLFLYGQGLFLIGLMGKVSGSYWYISSIITKLVSIGFDEPLKKGALYLIVPGITAIVLSFIIEAKANAKTESKTKRPKKVYVAKKENRKLDNQHDIRDNVVIRGKLETIKKANELLKKNNLSAYELSIINKAKKYREQFSTEELNNINKTIRYYKQ